MFHVENLKDTEVWDYISEGTKYGIFYSPAFCKYIDNKEEQGKVFVQLIFQHCDVYAVFRGNRNV